MLEFPGIYFPMFTPSTRMNPYAFRIPLLICYVSIVGKEDYLDPDPLVTGDRSVFLNRI